MSQSPSIPLEAQSLAQVITRYRFAYLLTTSDKGSPHAVQVDPRWQDGDLVIGDIGRHSRQNALARPAVGLLWPPASAADYSLIVDGRAVVTDESVRITPTRAVLHRSSAQPRSGVAGGCGSDCMELRVTGA